MEELLQPAPGLAPGWPTPVKQASFGRQLIGNLVTSSGCACAHRPPHGVRPRLRLRLRDRDRARVRDRLRVRDRVRHLPPHGAAQVAGALVRVRVRVRVGVRG